MKWVMCSAATAIAGFVGFFVARINAIKKQEQQAKKTQALIQELAALRGEMHATQQELWRY